LIARVSEAIGAQSTVLSMDVLRVPNSEHAVSGYEIVIHGGRTRTGKDALAWAKRGEALGAGELVVNSIDADGTREGYDIELTRMIADAVSIPVIASGGAGKPEHLLEVLTQGRADAALVASMVHFGTYKVSELKHFLHEHGVKVRTRW
jgi:cyclase